MVTQETIAVRDGDSGTNSVLIVLIVLIIVGLGIWWYSVNGGNMSKPAWDSNYNIDVKVPNMPNPTPTPAPPSPSPTPTPDTNP